MVSKKVNIDFDSISRDVEKAFKQVVNYFKNLTIDMIIAYAVLGVGIVALIISLTL